MLRSGQERKVFGIGWAKTGTTTLGNCFKILGYNHQTQDLDLVGKIAEGDLSRILTRAREKDTFEDWPWIILYKELDRAFPGSRFILTKRDPGNWISSYRNMLEKQGEASEKLNEVRRVLYGLPFPRVQEEQLLARYERHNQEVETYFANRPDDLLVVNWEKGHAWPEVCGFLEKDVPNEPFPHANKGKYQSEKRSKGLRALLHKWFK